jgi:hypothetical protein
MKLIEELGAVGYPNEIRPAVRDIHSPRVRRRDRPTP